MNSGKSIGRIEKLKEAILIARDVFSNAVKHGKTFYELKEMRCDIKSLEKELDALNKKLDKGFP